VDSVLRNLLRLIDFLPAFYALGVVVMIADPRSRRLGDLVAHTMVVKERRGRATLGVGVALDDVAGVPSGAPLWGSSLSSSPAAPDRGFNRGDLFKVPNADRLTADDLRLVRGFL